MKIFSGFLMFLSISSLCFGSENEKSEMLTEREIQELRDWIHSKRQVTVKDMGGALTLSGEVRFEVQSTSEDVNGIKQRGPGGAIPGTATRAYDVEVNLLCDYRTERTWATVKLEFDNNAGVVTGTFNRLALERAFLGIRIINADTFTFDMEAGRRRLNYTFDSRIQFNAFMDGLVFKYSRAFDVLGDFYLNGGPFIVNENKDHYAGIFEAGILNMWSTGLYAKYTFIDWDTKHYSNPREQAAFRFMNSQLILGYQGRPNWLGKRLVVYTAGLMNHAADSGPIVEKGKSPVDLTGGHKDNLAAYIGFSLGEARKKGDWSLDVNYQWVQAQSIPGFDVSGIGRGNIAGAGFYSKTGSYGLGSATDRKNAAGNGNYRGFIIDFLYSLTNNLVLEQTWMQSTRLEDIGPTFRFKQYEIELIYTF